MGSGASSPAIGRNRTSSLSDSSASSGVSLPPTGTSPCYTKLMQSLHDAVIGDGVVFQSTFGEKRALYLDYTASGRPLKFVEDYIDQEVYHKYANTHTSTCITARQTSLLREGARKYIKKCVNANDDDVLLFTGSGVTGAIHKLVSVLNIDPSSTVVIIGPYEHHSNILPWKESGATVHTISQTKTGQIDLRELEERVLHAAGKTVIGSFSAASNVTGIISDVKRVTRLLKKYGALVFWDYATAAPYLNIDMNVTQQGSVDAVFISPHKFLGGPQTPGILVAKKHLFRNKVPVIPGGGTVNYVYSGGHEYISDIEAREEGGTPAIIESIRAALAFNVKHSVGLRQLHDREAYLYKTGKDFWTQNCDHMTILGCGSVNRLPIFSFIVTHPTVSKLVHHNFISTLLNDLYGIQTRGGCACAGPYGEALLGIEGHQFIKYFRNENAKGVPTENCFCEEDQQCDHNVQEILKPGFCRLNLPYTMTEDELNFVLEAVRDVTEYGWRLLPLYTYNSHKGSWQAKKSPTEGLHHFEDLVLTSEGLSYDSHSIPKVSVKPLTRGYFQDTLEHAREMMSSVPGILLADTDSDYHSETREHEDNNTVWFVTPDEAESILHGFDTSQHRMFIKRRMSLSSLPEEKLPFNPRAMTTRCRERRNPGHVTAA